MAPAEPAPSALLRIEVACSVEPGRVQRVELLLPPGATVADAVRASALWPAGLPAELACAVWGRLAPAERVLRDRDRVELLRPLQVDPKEARRLRYRGQRQRARP